MVDSLDTKILEILEKDGRVSYSEIASALKLNESTIRKRVQALQKDGVIKKFSVEVEPTKIGINSVAIVGIDTEPAKLLEVAHKLTELSETKYVATATGDHMIMAEIWCKDGKELSKILSEKIGRIEGVKKICPAIILEKLKSF